MIGLSDRWFEIAVKIFPVVDDSNNYDIKLIQLVPQLIIEINLHFFVRSLAICIFLKLLSSCHLNRNNFKRKPIAYDHFKISKFNRHLPSSDFV